MDDQIGVLRHLPSELHYLISPAMRYGKYLWDHEIFEFLDSASNEETEELAAIAERVLLNDDYKRVLAFLDEHPITETNEAYRLYCLFLVMDYGDLQFDRAPEESE